MLVTAPKSPIQPYFGSRPSSSTAITWSFSGVVWELPFFVCCLSCVSYCGDCGDASAARRGQRLCQRSRCESRVDNSSAQYSVCLEGALHEPVKGFWYLMVQANHGSEKLGSMRSNEPEPDPFSSSKFPCVRIQGENAFELTCFHCNAPAQPPGPPHLPGHADSSCHNMAAWSVFSWLGQPDLLVP